MIQLKTYRLRASLRQAELAKIVGVSRSTIAMWESGASEPDIEMIHTLSRSLGVSVSELLGDVSSASNPSPSTPPTLSAANVTFPVIGDIAAGYDRLALDGWEDDTVEIPLSYLKGRPQSDFFVLRVKGDSMFPTYADGDRVLILKQDTIDYSGQVAAILYDDELSTLKKVEYIPGRMMRLVPINPNVPPIKIEGERLNHCRVIGVPRLLIREIEE